MTLDRKLVPRDQAHGTYRYLRYYNYTSPKLNLGCGYVHLDGCINIDCNPDCEPDIVCDLETGLLPYEDSTINYVCSVSTLEHVHNLLHVLGEIWRVCKPDAAVQIVVPHAHHTNAVEDPTHVRYFTEQSSQYWAAEMYQGAQANTGWYSCDRFDFRTTRCTRIPHRTAIESGAVEDPSLVAHGVNVILYLVFDLQVMKPMSKPAKRCVTVYT